MMNLAPFFEDPPATHETARTDRPQTNAEEKVGRMTMGVLWAAALLMIGLYVFIVWALSGWQFKSLP